MVDPATQVMFGCYTATLVAVAGAALVSGIQFVVVGAWRYREPMYLSYAVLCMCIAVLAFCNALLNSATSLTVAVEALRVMCFAAIASFPVLVVFIGAYTGKPTRRAAVWAVTALAGWFSWLNLTSPDTLLFDALGEGQHIVLPWGESLFNLAGTPSRWGWVFHLLTYVAFGWAMMRALLLYRAGQPLRGGLLGVCLLVQFLALLWGDIVVDTLGYPYPYLDAFSFLPFVLLMGLSLAVQLHLRTVQLEQTTRRLRAEAETRREAELSLRHTAYHDALTGLPNRLRALDRLADLQAEASAHGQHGAALMIDLDNFKTINDALGHHIGDRLLEAIADRLLSAAPADSMVARLGGDEFMVLLGGLQGEAETVNTRIREVATGIVAQLAAPIAVDSRVLAIGASMGVAIFPSGEADVADILRRADIALFRAKASGRNAVRLFLPHMQSEADARLALERGLRTALERNEMAGQFQLHFQPQLSRRGELLGAEALLRWHHPQLGDVPPDTFIRVAEEAGLIHALGGWVVDQACAHIRQWDRQGVVFGRHLAVNVSAWQLAHPHYVENVEARVRAAGIEPSRLTLELTESALLQGFDAALETLHRLHHSGFRLSLDDFGTGYSSLSYLQQLPLDELKIDRSFVSGLRPSAPSPLAGFIIDIGRRLGMAIIAEGVETSQQQAALQNLGCDALQGFLICPPLNEPDFVQWLADRQAKTSLRAARPD